MSGTSRAASYSVRRFDPRRGEHVQLPDYKGKCPVTLTPLDERDWAYLLVLKRQPNEKEEGQ